MCFYNSINVRAKALAERYNRDVVMFDDERYVVAAHSRNVYPIVTSSKEMQLFQWGLIPHWKQPKPNATRDEIDKLIQDVFIIQKGNYNARSETIFEKSSFKESILKRRCIIPSTGYIEYHHFTTRLKQPYFIFLKSEKVFSIAGIYDFWKHPLTGILHQTFSMITISAEGNELIKWIHNGGRSPERMPLIIEKEQEEKWLNPDLTKDEIKDFFKVYPMKDMDSFPIAKEFNEPDNSHNPVILSPIEQEIC